MEQKPTLEELFDQYRAKYDVRPVLALMGISDDQLYDILANALALGRPLTSEDEGEAGV